MNESYILGINLTWLWYNILFIYCWNLFPNRFLHLYWSSLFLPGFGLGQFWPHELASVCSISTL